MKRNKFFLKKNTITVVLILLSLTPLLWFWGRSGVLVNGVDTNFPLDPQSWFIRRLYVWNSTSNAGADFSSSTAGLFFHFIQLVPYKLGLPLQGVQITSFIFWFGLIIFGSFVFAKTFLKSRLSQILFVVLYSFNPYLFNTWENSKVSNLSLVAALPLGLALISKLNSGKLPYQRTAFLVVVTSVILSGTGINPAYFVSYFISLGIFAIVVTLTDKRLKLLAGLRNLLFVYVLTFLANLFWVIPTAYFILRNITASGSIDSLDFTNWLDSLSENTSLLNVLRLQGAWDWYAFDGVTGLPIYIPYVLNYFYRSPFILLSFLLPTLAILALIFIKREKKHFYTAFAALLLVGVFLGAGSHSPTGELFLWLSSHIPFFSLFRSPWYIFTPMTILSIAGLAALLGDKLSVTANKSATRLLSFGVALATLILILGNLIYSYPLVTGKIFRPTQKQNFYVQFPDYVFESKSFLNTSHSGRVIGYPDDEIERFDWGYVGVESILSLLSGKEVVYSGLNYTSSHIAQMVKELYRSMKIGQTDAASNLSAKMDIQWIFEKGDQSSLSPNLPDKVKENKVANFGGWAFYRFPNETNQKIYSPSHFYLGNIQNGGASIAGVIPGKGVLLDEKDSVVKSISSIFDHSDLIVLAKNSQIEELKKVTHSVSKLENRLLLRNLSEVLFSINIPENGEYNLIIERYGLENFGISVGEQLEAELDRERIVLEPERYSDSYVHYKKVSFTQGEHKIKIRLKNDNLVFGGNFDSGITFTKGGYGEGKAEYTIKEEGENKFLQVFNVGKANVSADFSVAEFDPLSPYYVELKYRQIYGNNGTVVVLQGNDKTLVKAQTERLPNYPEWNMFSFYYEPVLTESHMKVTLESPFPTDPLGTKVQYDSLQVQRVFTNNLFLRKEKPAIVQKAEINYTKSSPVLYKGNAKGDTRGHTITMSENYSPDWKFKIKGSKVEPKHFSANLYANSWFIQSAPEKYEFEIYYKPQNYFYIGTLISGATLLATIGFYFTKRK